jgi:hypothetical protein
MLLPATELAIAEAFLSGDVEIEGRMESAMYLGDALGKRLQSPGESHATSPPTRRACRVIQQLRRRN